MFKFLTFLPITLIAAGAQPVMAGMNATVRDAPGGKFTPAQFFSGDGCTGGNISPSIAWSGAPANTQSFAVTIYDPDAPGGHGWWHWLAVDLPPTVKDLPAGASGRAMPAGVIETMNDFGKAGYGGPCPPRGQDHHYRITVTALNVARLGVRPTDGWATVSTQIKAHRIAGATVIVRGAR